MNRRMILNTVLLGIFLFLFGFKLFPHPWHQIAGVLVLFPVLLHIINNRRWFTALKRGRWDKKRRLWTAANLALLSGVFLTVFTGLLCSDYVTASYGSTLPYNAHLVSGIHKLLTKILLLLIAIHVLYTGKPFPPGYAMASEAELSGRHRQPYKTAETELSYSTFCFRCFHLPLTIPPGQKNCTVL